MKYKIRKLSNLKRKNLFDTYEPEKKIKINRENTVPFLVRIGHRLVCFGGLISFWAVSGLIVLKGLFNAEEKIKKFSLNNRVVEIRIKKR